MNIAKTLRGIAEDLAHFVEEYRRGDVPDLETIRIACRRIEAQADMLDEGLHE